MIVVELPSFDAPQDVAEPLLRNGIMAPRINGLTEIRDETVFAKKLVIGNRTWVHNLVWSPTDYRIAAWTSGNMQFSDGTVYAISSGNTGNMAATTYIYFNKTGTLQTTTTYSDALGEEKIILAIAQPVLSNTAADCIITAFDSLGTTIDGDKIVTGRIQTTDGKTYWDLDDNEFVMSDSSNPRLAFGDL